MKINIYQKKKLNQVYSINKKEPDNMETGSF